MDLYENIVAYQRNLVVTGTSGRANPEAEEDGPFSCWAAQIERFHSNEHRERKGVVYLFGGGEECGERLVVCDVNRPNVKCR